MTTPSPPVGACRDCRHFRNDPAFLEGIVAGLTSLSSGHASVRGDDGICLYHDRYAAAWSGCRFFAPPASRPAETA